MVGAMLSNSVRLFTIRGIEVGVHYSWLIIFALVTWSLAVGVYPGTPGMPRLADWEFWVLGALTALLLFASVLVHELAHSFVALARGIQARSITLFIFGGVSNLSGEAKEASTEFVVAIVGPLASFAVAAVMYGLATVISEPRAELVLSYLFLINLTLGIFNLLPGFPLDGGRVLRSILWRITGSMERATRWAAGVGRIVSLLMAAYAIYLVVIQDSIIGGLWTAAIAWFLYFAASNSVKQVAIQRRLNGVRTVDAIQLDSTTVPLEMTVDELLARYVLPDARRAVAVATDGRLVGIVTVKDIVKVPAAQRGTTTVGQIMGGHQGLHTVGADAPALEAFELLDEHGLEQIAVMDGDRFIGLLTRDDVARQLQLREALDT